MVFLDFKSSRVDRSICAMLLVFRDQSYSALRLRQRHAMFRELFLYVVLSANTYAYLHDGIKSNINNQPDLHFFI